jgi:hypothetical protein
MIEALFHASVVLRWAFGDEAARTGALRIEAALGDGRVNAVEPPLFLFEVACTLERGIRERRFDRTRAEQILRALESVALDETIRTISPDRQTGWRSPLGSAPPTPPTSRSRGPAARSS